MCHGSQNFGAEFVVLFHNNLLLFNKTVNHFPRINFLIKNKKEIISIFPRIIKIIKDILVKLLKSKKFKLFKPYSDEVTVLVSVSMDNLKAFSKFILSNVKIADKTNIEIMNKIKTKKAILKSSSSIYDSVLNKFLSKIFFGFTNL